MTFFKNLKDAAQKTSGQQSTSKQEQSIQQDSKPIELEHEPKVQEHQSTLTCKELALKKIQRIEENLIEVNKEIDDLHRQIGAHVEKNEDYTYILDIVKEKRQKIDELASQIINTQDEYLCPSCKKEFPPESLFCPFCGTKLKQEESVITDDSKPETEIQ